MRGLGMLHLGKGTRAIADHVAARSQVATGPLPHVLVGEVRHRRQAHVQGAAIGAGLHRSDEGRLVGCATPAVDMARALPAEVGIVDLQTPLQTVALIALRHGLHQLVLHEPRRFVGHAQLALERQGADGVLVLREQVHGQEPPPQGQVGVLHHGAHDR